MQGLADRRPEHRSRDAAIPDGLVDVRRNDLGSVRNQVLVVLILAIDDRRERAGVAFRARDRAIHVTDISHTIAKVLNRWSRLVLRLDRTVISDLFDLEVDVPRHC